MNTSNKKEKRYGSKSSIELANFCVHDEIIEFIIGNVYKLMLKINIF